MVTVAAVYQQPDQAPTHQRWVTDFAAALDQGRTGAYVGFLGDEGRPGCVVGVRRGADSAKTSSTSSVEIEHMPSAVTTRIAHEGG